MSKPITAVIVGAGLRAMKYASYALKHPNQLKIVGVAEPNPLRRQNAAEKFGIASNAVFDSAEALAARPAIADAAINGTLDLLHVPTTLPLLDAGYHVLLEKPIAPNQEEMLRLWHRQQETQRCVMICHVLRYAPFYQHIFELVQQGTIGRILTMHTSENVSYHHIAAGFVRGKFNRTQNAASMFIQKCCHDMDLLAWFTCATRPCRVASFGNRSCFRAQCAPQGAGTRCLVDCAIEPDCSYSCKKHYIDHDWWHSYVWEAIRHIPNPTLDDKLQSLRTNNPFGRCVWHCDNDVVDHQTVIIEFADGCIASHDMIGTVAKPCRTIHLVGTKGEIEGVMEEGRFVIRHPDVSAGADSEHAYSSREIQLNITDDMHGGGDMRLVEDFIKRLASQAVSNRTSELINSIYGHQIAYAADESMVSKRTIELPALR